MSKRITRKDCLEEAYRLLSLNTAPAQQAVPLKAIAWIELAKQLERSSLRIEDDR